ncbi:flagellar hook-basal body complex protein [Clostridium sp. JN-9]|uniref:flagellar hook-basal body protein n=1 Tax=Clostridium sp. JN-9 TaxID=2507159 RepID=UPI000FFE2033|nr:flagellar hook-basal body complex protein [Clostridium sp. JN-9]QAT39955.1 flagellar hook-basal body complex protein [Clostridium sp. JN-9]
MLRSMSSAITGLTLNQTALDVIGNNIANMGTTGYKAQTLTFSDSLSQSMRDPNAPSPTYGGSNGIQIGLGAGIAGVNTLLTQGNFQPTSRNLDNAIDGDGYFIVGEGPTMFAPGDGITVDANHKFTDNGNPSHEDIQYTRDGSFNLDQDGNLVTASGLRVLGYSMLDKKAGAASSISNNGTINFVNANSSAGIKAVSGTLRTLRIPQVIQENGKDEKVKNFSIDKSGVIMAVLDDGNTSAVGQIAMASFANPAGLVKLGNNVVQSSPDSGAPIIRSGYKDDNDNSKGFGSIQNGVLEMSNVDIAEQFTKMIEATRSFQANGKMITTGDEILQDLVNLKR